MQQDGNKGENLAQLAAWRALWERLLARKRSDGKTPPVTSTHTQPTKQEASEKERDAASYPQ